jgi:hypothetical protein
MFFPFIEPALPSASMCCMLYTQRPLIMGHIIKPPKFTPSSPPLLGLVWCVGGWGWGGGTVASLTDPCEERFDRGNCLRASFLPLPTTHTIMEERVHSQHLRSEIIVLDDLYNP